MKEWKKVSKNEIAGLAWVLLCTVLLLLVVTLGIWGYETNDDMYLAMIPSGFFGKFIPYTIYNNIIQGYFLAAISSVFPVVNWTFIYYFLLIFISYVLIGVCCIWKKGMIQGTLLSIIFLCSTGVSMFCRMNFSKTGALVFLAGFITAMWLSEDLERKRNKIIFYVALIFMILGSFVRYDTTVALLPFYVLGVIYLFVKYKYKLKRIVPFVGAFAIILLCWGLNSYVYHNSPEWKEYWDYASVNILDYGIPDYEAHQEEYETLGLSENDIICLNSWKYLDSTVYSKEIMVGIKAIRDNSKPSLYEEMPRIITGFGQLFRANVYLYVLIGLLFYLFLKISNIDRIMLFMVMGLGCAEMAYLLLINRCIEHSAYIPILAVFTYVLYLSKEGEKNKHFHAFIGFMCLCSIVMLGGKDVPKMKKYPLPLEGTSTEVYKTLSSWKECLFVWDPGVDAAVCNLGFSPIDNFPYGGHSNSVITGGWVALSPFMEDIGEEYGQRSNVFRLLAENENVFYVSSEGIYCDVIEKYIQEHYNPKAHCVQVTEVYGFGIYTFIEIEDN